MQNTIMPVQITIRNVPDELRDVLADRARDERKSMQEYLLEQLEVLAQRPSVAQWLASVSQRKASRPTSLSRAEILAHRDRDRR